MSPIKRLLRRVPIVRRAAMQYALDVRKKKRDKDWTYVQSVLSLVGMMTIQWAGVERLLDELIAHYQHHYTDLSQEHPRSLSNKLKYLRAMQRNEKLPEKMREFLRETRITAKRLGDDRHDIIHGLLHRMPGATSVKWRTQRILYRGPLAQPTQREYHSNELTDLAAEIARFSHELARKVWVITRDDHSQFPPSDIQDALSQLGMA